MPLINYENYYGYNEPLNIYQPPINENENYYENNENEPENNYYDFISQQL